MEESIFNQLKRDLVSVLKILQQSNSRLHQTLWKFSGYEKEKLEDIEKFGRLLARLLEVVDETK